jgi:putative transposase
MSRFRKLSHTLWHCQYHIVWVPKYRHKILTDHIGNEVRNCIKAFSEQKHVEIFEMNIQPDHIHLITMIPPKISVSDYCGTTLYPCPPWEQGKLTPLQGLTQNHPL